MSRCTCVNGVKFCTCQPGLAPDYAVKLNSPGVRALADRISVAVAGDKQIGGFSHISAGMFGHRMTALIVELADREAELYAAQDQITGLQELMAAQRAPESLDAAVRYLVAQADAEEVTEHYASGGSPQHGHTVPGRWDGDKKHPKGSLCEECAAWNTLRQYASTEIVAEAQVIEEASVTQPVELILHSALLPISARGPKEAVLDLGIRWEKFWGNPVTSEVRLLGCTNVPADLPSWLEVKK